MKVAMRRVFSIIGVAIVGSVLMLSRILATATPRPHHAAPGSPAPTGMVLVPAGEFISGSDDAGAEEDAGPAQRKSLPEFYIDRTEVTNEEYRHFKPEYAFPAGEERLPVTNVTFDEAASYAKWAGKRLPTDDEWEKAARGTDGRRYPWGSQWDPHRVAKRAVRTARHAAGSGSSCHDAPSRVQPVGSVPAGASPYGCLDMAGNAWEWVQGYFKGNHEQRILRGGAVGYGELACRTYSRGVEGSGVT